MDKIIFNKIIEVKEKNFIEEIQLVKHKVSIFCLPFY